jgi:hypothetical protein
LNLNLLLGSYSQGLLAQRASCRPAAWADQEAAAVPAAQEAAEGQALARSGPATLPDQDQGTLSEKKKGVLERFGERLEDRIGQSGKYDPVAASIEIEKLVSEASQIGDSLGQAKANEFMNRVLVATDGSAGPDQVGLAVESFFAEAAQAARDNPTAYQKLEQAKRTFSRLDDPETDSDGRAAASQDASQGSPAQARLFQSYVQGHRPFPSAAAFLNAPSGNLVNAVA